MQPCKSQWRTGLVNCDMPYVYCSLSSRWRTALEFWAGFETAGTPLLSRVCLSGAQILLLARNTQCVRQKKRLNRLLALVYQEAKYDTRPSLCCSITSTRSTHTTHSTLGSQGSVNACRRIDVATQSNFTLPCSITPLLSAAQAKQIEWVSQVK